MLIDQESNCELLKKDQWINWKVLQFARNSVRAVVQKLVVRIARKLAVWRIHIV